MVQIGFYAWAATALAMLLLILRNNPHPQRIIGRYLLICLAWLSYITVITNTGVLNDFGLPPRVPLLIVFPAIAGILFIANRRSFQTVLQNTPLHLPVLLQSFRVVVELLIYGAFLQGVFPKRATFEGINFDILVGLSSLIVGILVQRKKISLNWLLAWNIASLIILSITVYSFIGTLYFTNYLLLNGSKGFIQFPFVLLSSVLLPVAIFLHVFSIRQVLLHWQFLRKQSPVKHANARRLHVLAKP